MGIFSAMLNWSCSGKSCEQDMDFNSSYMVHERPEGLQHENKYLLITCLQCLAHFTRRRRLYLRVVSAKFGLRDDLRLGQINLDFCLRVTNNDSHFFPMLKLPTMPFQINSATLMKSFFDLLICSYAPYKVWSVLK